MSDYKKYLEKYRLVLGLEVHLQPKTETKMFCYCKADIWGAEPNTHTCPACLGLPGALPVPNFEAVQKTQLLGLALGCDLNSNSRFDRKHYFYPDLPKGYQISQYKQPLCENGRIELDSGAVADIERIHLEEDVAKSFHEGSKTLIDFNKSSMPLIEVVTRPCFKTIEDAVDYCKKLQNIVRYIGISEVDMEKGQMRLEANISLRTPEMEARGELPNYKVEVKNINSFKFMEKAVQAEVERQGIALDAGETLRQENRGYNEFTGKTVLQRVKEEASDYRYFPEPDIPPMHFEDSDFEALRKQLPTLPHEYRTKFVNEYGVPEGIAKTLVEVMGLNFVSIYLLAVARGFDPKKSANLMVNKKELQELSALPDVLLEKLAEMLKYEDKPELGSDLLIDLAKKAISDNPKAVEDYKKGKVASIQFLVGVVMRDSKGAARADDVRSLLVDLLSV
jgi:aspartyl-tRNA(Asn)/glutamyl-tRNA(Gln) amidotransferase subunit B